MKKILIKLLIVITTFSTPVMLGACSVFKQANQVTQVITGNLTDAQTIRGAAIGILTTLNVIDTTVGQLTDTTTNVETLKKYKEIVTKTSSLGEKVNKFITNINPLLEKETNGELTELDELALDQSAVEYDILKAELDDVVELASKQGIEVK